MLKAYYRLTKPGIIYGNVMTATAGFLLATQHAINFGLLLATVAGTALVIASACVFNNYIDRDIDRKMARTKKRATVTGEISGRNALTYATILGVVGILILALYVNYLTVVIGWIAFVDYVVLYGISKRKSVHGTLVGSIAGSAPLVAGYCAVSGRFDAEALILFLIMTFWQMPHFYAIAIYRAKDYAAAGIPVLPVAKNVQTAKIQIIAYIIAFVLTVASLTLFGYTGYTFLVVTAAINLLWLYKGFQGFKTEDSVTWARKMFFFSLKVLLVLSLMLAVGAHLP